MAKIVLALFGGAVVLVGSFFLSLQVLDYFGLFHSGPNVLLTLSGKDSLVISPGETYNLTYRTSGATSCEIVYRSTVDGSSGRLPVPPNTTGTAPSGLVGDYTLTCIGPNGATTSTSVRINRAPKYFK